VLPNSDDLELHTSTTIKMKLGMLIIAPLSVCLGFAPPTRLSGKIRCTPRFLSSNSQDDARRQSRFQGMQREPTANELAVMDDMITKLSNAKPYELVPSALFPRRASFCALPRELTRQQIQWRRKN
jgi:hypothetical protein